MRVNATTTGSRRILRLEGRFDFDARREFRDAIKTAVADAQLAAIELDLRGVDYLDSSALGMLLLSQEEAKVAGKSVALSNPSGTVKKVLDIANFDKLFVIT